MAYIIGDNTQKTKTAIEKARSMTQQIGTRSAGGQMVDLRSTAATTAANIKATAANVVVPKPTAQQPASGGYGGSGGGGSVSMKSSLSGGGGGGSSGDGSSTNDEYRQALIKAKQGAINAEYETNASIIKNNLTRALAALNQNKAALEPLYQRQLGSIAQNQFKSAETTKEIMNQGGWNASNSGLAVGEQTKIGMTADKQRGEALQAKTTAENEYNSQIATEQMAADESLGALGRWRSSQLSAAEADALVTSTEYGRAIYESDRDFALTQRQFDESVRQFEVQLSEQRANRTAAAKASAARASSDGTAQSAYNQYLAQLYTAVSPEDAYVLLSKTLQGADLPDSMKEDMIAQYNKFGTAWNIKNSQTAQNGQYDFSQMNQ